MYPLLRRFRRKATEDRQKYFTSTFEERQPIPSPTGIYRVDALGLDVVMPLDTWLASKRHKFITLGLGVTAYMNYAQVALLEHDPKAVAIMPYSGEISGDLGVTVIVTKWTVPPTRYTPMEVKNAGSGAC